MFSSFTATPPAGLTGCQGVAEARCTYGDCGAAVVHQAGVVRD